MTDTDTHTGTRITQVGTVMVPVSDYERLSAGGVDVDEVVRMGEPIPPMLLFRDPDGNRFMAVQRG